MIDVVWLLILLLPGFSAAEEVVTFMAEAESHYQRRGEAGENQKAIEGFQKALELDTKNYDAAWKLSKALWYQGKHMPKDQQAEFFQKGIDAGKKAVQNDAKGCLGHFWLGVNEALFAESSGMFKALSLIDDIKEEMNRTIALDPDCECAGAQRVLGQLYARLPWFKGGSKTKAIASLKESLQRCPDDTQSRMFLAEIYLDQHQKGLAIQQLKLVLKQEPDPKWVPETLENQNIAKKMLEKLN